MIYVGIDFRQQWCANAASSIDDQYEDEIEAWDFLE